MLTLSSLGYAGTVMSCHRFGRLSQTVLREMRVPLRRGDRGMAEQFLNVIDTQTVVHQG